MGFDTAIARLDELREAPLALPPGLLPGPLASGLFLSLARTPRSAAARPASRARGAVPGVGMVLGRVGSGVCLPLGGLVGAAGPFPVLGIGGAVAGSAPRDIPRNSLAGVPILPTRHFRPGDWAAGCGREGTVEGVEARATAVRVRGDRRRAATPDTALPTDEILAGTAPDKRRLPRAAAAASPEPSA